MAIDPIGVILLCFAAYIMFSTVRSRFKKNLARCTEHGMGVIVKIDNLTGRPLIRLFPSKTMPVEFWHDRPYWLENGNNPPYGTKLTVYFDPGDPARGPHILASEIETHKKSIRNCRILAAALTVTGTVMLLCSYIPKA